MPHERDPEKRKIGACRPGIEAIATSGLFKGFEFKAYDHLSRTCNPPKSPESILIVKVDQASLDSLNSEGITWPWSRQV